MTTVYTQLGGFLQATREEKSLSLREVERRTGISNAYLSQLEGGKVRQPSPVILHKLAKVYETSYPELLRLVGYPVPGDGETSEPPGPARRIGPLTEEEEEALLEYLQFLRSRQGTGRPR